MRKAPPAASPDAYVAALDGWRRTLVESLRAAVRAASRLDEVVKWGHLVYLGVGPVVLIRAEDERVLFGFWQGQRFQHLEPRLKAGGKYEMASIELRQGTTLTPIVARRLTRAAVAANKAAGDPTAVVRSVTPRGTASVSRAAARRPRR